MPNRIKRPMNELEKDQDAINLFQVKRFFERTREDFIQYKFSEGEINIIEMFLEWLNEDVIRLARPFEYESKIFGL